MKRIVTLYITSLLILLTSFSFSFSTAIHENKTIYVDDDGTADYTSIQAAINAAADGDTIFVYAGEYRESLNIDKSLHILGEDKDSTIINKTASVLVTINHEHVHFEGFSLIDADDVWLDDAAVIVVYSDNNHIENNIMITNLYNGIKLHPGTKQNAINHNSIKAGYAGIRLTGSWDNHISNNHLFGYSIGINMEYSFNNNIQSNQFESTGMGVFLIDCYDNNFLQNNFIDGGDDVYIHPHLSFNDWNNNYWKDYNGKLPFYVVTQRYIPRTDIPLIFWFDMLRIDWDPASEPYIIEE